MKKVKVLLAICFFLCGSLLGGSLLAWADISSGSTYVLKQSVFNEAGPGGSSSAYSLKNSVGFWVSYYYMSSGNYNTARSGLTSFLNSPPVLSVTSYNQGLPSTDQTPTLEWAYTDEENNPQTKFQAQVSKDNFNTTVSDSGVVNSGEKSFTTPPLQESSGELPYQWRVRGYDGTEWSSWASTSQGFHIGAGNFYLSKLGAKTGAFGEEILESSWQKNTGPYFYWEPPEGVDIAGYSFSLDTQPLEQLATTALHYQYPEGALADGQHIFYVKPQNTSLVWGQISDFNIWVDISPPLVSNLVPAAKALLNQKDPEISCTLRDEFSGVDFTSLELKVNNQKVSPQVDEASGVARYQPQGLSDGDITVSVQVKDKLGNSNVPLVWSFVIDTQPPEGKVTINHGEKITHSIKVNLQLEAKDKISQVKEMIISNDGVFDTEVWEPFQTERRNWILPAVNGERSVSVRFKDSAGNISDIYSSKITLEIIAPETIIVSGPSGLTRETSATFTYKSTLEGCLFSYKFDNDSWSEWNLQTQASKNNLTTGNHYFMVKAGKDLNKNGVIDEDEEDPNPAQRIWTISLTGISGPEILPEKPTQFYREE